MLFFRTLVKLCVKIQQQSWELNVECLLSYYLLCIYRVRTLVEVYWKLIWIDFGHYNSQCGNYYATLLIFPKLNRSWYNLSFSSFNLVFLIFGGTSVLMAQGIGTSLRRLEDVMLRQIFLSWAIRLEDVLKISWRPMTKVKISVDIRLD